MPVWVSSLAFVPNTGAQPTLVEGIAHHQVRYTVEEPLLILIVDTAGPRKINVLITEVYVLISEVDLYTKVYYWDLRNCPD